MHNYQDKSRGERLQKVLAEAGVASRRRCEELIELGEVRVNGEVVRDLPAWVDPGQDRLVVSGRRVDAAQRHVYVMLFKPRGVVSTNSDPEGRPRAIDLVEHPSKVRLYPVGRLDIDSSGLMLLTNDGELANRLTHPRYGIHKLYEVTVRGQLDAAAVKELEKGIFLSDRRSGGASRTQRVLLRLKKRDRDRTRLVMELQEGRNRQIRRMMAALGHPVKKLRRVQLGPLKLKGLSPGEWRELTSSEVRALRTASGRSGSGAKSGRKTVSPAGRKPGRKTGTGTNQGVTKKASMKRPAKSSTKRPASSRGQDSRTAQSNRSTRRSRR